MDASLTDLIHGHGDRKAEYGYDYQGRRIEKRVWTYDGEDWVPTEHRKFAWSGWLMLLELDGLEEDAVVRKYTWGLDLAGVASGAAAGRLGDTGMLEGAGGIGGLLAMSDPNDPNDPNDPSGDFVYFYDANGNVGQLMDLNEPNAAAAVVASYEYDPYGNLIAQEGAYADENPIRWSTKYWDAETGLGYWGYRYYDPRLGRWINRDPIGEQGGDNVYGYVANAPFTYVDIAGFSPWASLPGCPPGFHFDRLRQQCVQDTPASQPATKPSYPPPTCTPMPGKTCTGTTNGCGTSAYKGSDAPSGVNFRGACDKHDLCYATLEKTKKQCDDELLANMQAACRAAGKTESEEERFSCMWWAKFYYTLVDTTSAARDAYDEAQRKEQEYWDQWQREHRNDWLPIDPNDDLLYPRALPIGCPKQMV